MKCLTCHFSHQNLQIHVNDKHKIAEIEGVWIEIQNRGEDANIFNPKIYDECKNHLVLSPFFIFVHIWNLNNHFNEKLWSLHPNLSFAGFIVKVSKKSKKSNEKD